MKTWWYTYWNFEVRIRQTHLQIHFGCRSLVRILFSTFSRCTSKYLNVCLTCYEKTLENNPTLEDTHTCPWVEAVVGNGHENTVTSDGSRRIEGESSSRAGTTTLTHILTQVTMKQYWRHFWLVSFWCEHLSKASCHSTAPPMCLDLPLFTETNRPMCTNSGSGRHLWP